MEAVIVEIVQKLRSLSETKVLEVLDFVDFLAQSKKHLISQPSDRDLTGDHEEFEAIADRIADEFQTYLGGIKLSVSDYAVSRAGIYEEHP